MGAHQDAAESLTTEPDCEPRDVRVRQPGRPAIRRSSRTETDSRRRAASGIGTCCRCACTPACAAIRPARQADRRSAGGSSHTPRSPARRGLSVYSRIAKALIYKAGILRPFTAMLLVLFANRPFKSQLLYQLSYRLAPPNAWAMFDAAGRMHRRRGVCVGRGGRRCKGENGIFQAIRHGNDDRPMSNAPQNGGFSFIIIPNMVLFAVLPFAGRGDFVLNIDEVKYCSTDRLLSPYVKLRMVGGNIWRCEWKLFRSCE